MNHELPNMLETCTEKDGCDVTHISCQLIKHLSEENVFKFEEYNLIEEASDKLINGKIWGYIYFHQNFSDAFFSRVIDVTNLETDIINQSSIQVCNIFLTASNAQRS